MVTKSGRSVARLRGRSPHVQCAIGGCNGRKLRGIAHCCMKVYEKMISLRARSTAPWVHRETGPARRKVKHFAIADVDNPHRAQPVDNPELLAKTENHPLCR